MKKIKSNKLLFLLLGCILHTSIYADDLIQYISQPAMDEQQHHYFLSESNNPVHENIRFIDVNFNAFTDSEITIEIDNYSWTFEKEERSRSLDPNRQSWIGKIPSSQADYAHFVVNKKEDIVVGHITIDGWIYVIRPLSGGLHIFASVNDANAEGCGVQREHMYPADVIPNKPKPVDNPDIVYDVEEDNSRATGECNIRVMIIFTDDADAALADILSDINNQFNIANTGYQNSGLPMRIEMAACYEEFYTEVDLNTTLNDVTNGNGAFSDAATNRILWDADQVAVIMSGGGGLAWVQLQANRQFSVTGINNFSVFTFHHELGHNAECTHDLVNNSQPGTAPYAGWGEPTTSCFRTILAYQPACGTGFGCSRHNIFSDNNGTWNCGGTNYPKGTISNRNTDRLILSDDDIVDYEIVPNTSIYGSDYNWFSGEAVHRAANIEVGYNSATNNFELFSGSEGSFRASDEVTLGEGFWARSGSEFTAYLESCTPAFTPAPDETEAQTQQKSGIDDNEDVRLAVAPNPFSQTTNINFFLDDESIVNVSVYNLQGSLVSNLMDNLAQQAGSYTLEFDGRDLAAGTYICIVRIDNQIFKESLVLSGQ